MELTGNMFHIIVRLLAAAVLGSLIGFEREFHGKEAGIRTHALVALGSALFMVVSIMMYETYRGAAQVDPARIAAQVVTGVGFLGAGAIIRSGGGIKGLTTAAGIWVAAAVGLAAGLGYYGAAVSATVMALVILVPLAWLGRRMRGVDA